MFIHDTSGSQYASSLWEKNLMNCFSCYAKWHNFIKWTEIISALLRRELADGSHDIMDKEQWAFKDWVLLPSSSVIFCVLIRMLMGSLINLLLFYNKRSLFAETEKKAIIGIQKGSS